MCQIKQCWHVKWSSSSSSCLCNSFNVFFCTLAETLLFECLAAWASFPCIDYIYVSHFATPECVDLRRKRRRRSSQVCFHFAPVYLEHIYIRKYHQTTFSCSIVFLWQPHTMRSNWRNRCKTNFCGWYFSERKIHIPVSQNAIDIELCKFFNHST